MPANLNALIRYKTIDQCLSNSYRQWTIADLTEACSSALRESRGIQGISERTIKEDIRVMRSDILGFNAPIVQQDGHYSYEYTTYSIWNVSVSETELLSRILKFILEIQSEINHPELREIIESISEVLPTNEAQIESLDEVSGLYEDRQPLYNFHSSKTLAGTKPELVEEQYEEHDLEGRKEKPMAISIGKLERVWLKIFKTI